MAAPAATLLDPTKPEKLRVIISDELLGKPSQDKDIFTGVRYNHRATDAAPAGARIKAGPIGSGTFDLALREADGSKYSYNGTRATNDGQFVLVFDPNRNALVLHRLDSLFNMNLTATPDTEDAIALRRQHAYLSGHGVPSHLEKKAAAAAGGATNAKASKGATNALRANPKKKPAPAAKKKDPAPKKPAAKKSAPATAEPEPLTLPRAPVAAASPSPPPAPPAETQKKKKKPADSDDEDEDSDDGGLEIVYTDVKASSNNARSAPGQSPPAQPTRRFSEFFQNHNEADDDADAEADPDDDVPDVVEEEDEEDAPQANEQQEEADDFDEMDLEAALEQELEGAVAEESDISEED